LISIISKQHCGRSNREIHCSEAICPGDFPALVLWEIGFGLIIQLAMLPYHPRYLTGLCFHLYTRGFASNNYAPQ
jgi:hypothetical protein